MTSTKQRPCLWGGGSIIFAFLILFLLTQLVSIGQIKKPIGINKPGKKTVIPLAPPPPFIPEPIGPGSCTSEEIGEPGHFNWIPVNTDLGNRIHRLWLGRNTTIFDKFERFMVGVNQSNPVSILDVHYPENNLSAALLGLSVTTGGCSRVGLVAGDKYTSWVGSYSSDPDGDFPSGLPFQVRAGQTNSGYWDDWSEGTFIHLNPQNERIGINTAAPESTLDVNGDAKVELGLKVGGGATIGYGFSTNAPGNGLIVNGSVGVGTENPESKLSVFGNSPANTFNKLLTLGNGYQSGFLNEPTLTFTNGLPENHTNHYCWNVGARVAGSPSYFRISKQFGGATNEYLRILDNGKVIIGTNAPSATNLFQNWKLAVDGLINSKEVVVTPTATWGDYVFDEGYQLPDLLELEKKIKKEKHLPEIPTAAEVKLNGLQLGELQVVLVKKIEELTLLLIEQKKEIESLKIQINQNTK